MLLLKAVAVSDIMGCSSVAATWAETRNVGLKEAALHFHFDSSAGFSNV
jgi:hypothetical protein